MRRRSSLWLFRSLLLGLPAVLVCGSCGVKPRTDPARNLPSSASARDALEKSLRAWKDSPKIERIVTSARPIMFVEQQQPFGQELHDFEILGESPGYQGYRRFRVKLLLDNPQETLVASYCVFGQGPIWVYRAEDFDMIMHMDASMMSTPPDQTDEGEGISRDRHSRDHSENHSAPAGESKPTTGGSRGTP